jgi:hypothetical protein
VDDKGGRTAEGTDHGLPYLKIITHNVLRGIKDSIYKLSRDKNVK